MSCSDEIREGTFANQQTPLSCGKCEGCQDLIRKLWAFRIQAEAMHSEFTYFLTLTYGGDVETENGETARNPDTLAPNYDHIEKFIKALHNEGNRTGNFKCRFVIVPEFGELKGRLHWHAILFFTPRDPHRPTIYPTWEIETDKVMGPHWKHGFTHALLLAGKETYAKGAYIHKMALYAMKEEAVTELKMRRSKNPMIGWQLIAEKADKDAAFGIFQPYFLLTDADSIKRQLRDPAIQRKLRDRKIDRIKPDAMRLPMLQAQKKAYCRFFMEAWKARKENENWPMPRVSPFSLKYKAMDEHHYERQQPEWVHPCNKVLDERAGKHFDLDFEQKQLLRQLREKNPKWTPNKAPRTVHLEGTHFETVFIERDEMGMTYARGYGPTGELEFQRELRSDAEIKAAKGENWTWRPRDYIG